MRTTLAIDVTVGPPKGFATVECLTDREAEKTVSLLNDSRIDDNRAKVELLQDPRDLTPGTDCPRRGRKKHRVRSATVPLLVVAAPMGASPARGHDRWPRSTTGFRGPKRSGPRATEAGGAQGS